MAPGQYRHAVEAVNKLKDGARRSVPSRGSVGSMFRQRILIGEVDPTLPRDGY